MPNTIAFLMLGLVPLAAVLAFRLLAPGRALLVVILGGYLLLPSPPTAFDLPLVPPLDKSSLPALMSLLCLLVLRPPEARGFWPEAPLVRLLLGLYVTVPLATALTNADPVAWGSYELPATSLKDGLGLCIQNALTVLPFLLARQHLARGGAARDLALALVLAGLVYAPLMLVEVPLGPFLHEALYGFSQASLEQAERGETFRPVVFLQHGLWTAFFALMACAAAWTLWRHESGKRLRYLGVGLGLTLLLVAMKSFGALAMALLLLPLILLTGRRSQTLVAALVAALSLTYPLLKTADLVPEERLLTRIERIDPERAFSLEFRLENEDRLFDRALERPAFGWGSWGRNHVMNAGTGEWQTISDGRWVITLGVFGWVGFLAEFGLLISPILLLLAGGITRAPERFSPYAPPLALLLAFNTLDLIPNATLTPLSWLIAGVLLAHAERPERRGAPAAAPGPGGPGLRWKPIL
ncbi:hypothetical protein [Roseivivax sp.]